MNEIVLDDDSVRQNLFPFTLTRSVADIRIGILTIREKWEKLFNYTITNKLVKSSSPVLPANIIPNNNLVNAIREKKSDQYLISASDSKIIKYPWHIFQLNGEIIKTDFILITKGRKSEPVSSTNTLINRENIFIEKKYRSQGLGNKLINRVIGIAKRRNVTRLRLSAMAQNESAIKFYKSHGFEDVQVILEKKLR